MMLGMYDASAPVFLQGLKGLATMLAKAEAFAAATGTDPATLVSARLAEDMFPFSRQVQIATDHARGAMARLAGRERPSWPDDETTLGQLAERVGKARAYVEGFARADIDGSEARAFSMKVGPNMMDFVGAPYLTTFAIPNFHFHVTTAYAILRGRGVALGKGDFLGR
jgi:hypothetical protein